MRDVPELLTGLPEIFVTKASIAEVAVDRSVQDAPPTMPAAVRSASVGFGQYAAATTESTNPEGTPDNRRFRK